MRKDITPTYTQFWRPWGSQYVYESHAYQHSLVDGEMCMQAMYTNAVVSTIMVTLCLWEPRISTRSIVNDGAHSICMETLKSNTVVSMKILIIYVWKPWLSTRNIVVDDAHTMCTEVIPNET